MKARILYPLLYSMHSKEGTFQSGSSQRPSQVLHAPAAISEPEPVRDVAYGEGTRVTLGEPPHHKHVEVFHAASVVRITGANLRLEVFRAAAPQVNEAGVLVSTRDADLHLGVLPTGQLVLAGPEYTPPPLASPTPLAFRASASAAPQASAELATPPPPLPRLTPVDSARALETSAARGKEGQPELLVGQVLTDPEFYQTRSTKGGRELRAKFRYQEFVEGSDDRVFDVIAARTQAESIRTRGIHQGEEVQVKGVRHIETHDRKTGKPLPEPVAWVWAHAVSRKRPATM